MFCHTRYSPCCVTWCILVGILQWGHQTQIHNTGGSDISSVSQQAQQQPLHWSASVDSAHSHTIDPAHHVIDSASSPQSHILQTQWTGSSHSPTSKPVNFDSAPATICDPVSTSVRHCTYMYRVIVGQGSCIG